MVDQFWAPTPAACLLDLIGNPFGDGRSGHAARHRGSSAVPVRSHEGIMSKYRMQIVLIALMGLLATACFSSPAYAETGAVSVVFTKGGFIVGVGGGHGVLTFRGKHYRFA